MNSSTQRRRPARRDFDSSRSVRLPFRIGSLIVGVLACGALLTLAPRRPPPIAEAESESTPNPRPDSPPPSEQTEDTSIVRKPRGAGNGRVSKGLAATTPTPALARSSLPEPTAETRQLVDSLFQPGMALTQDQTTQWKQSLTQLVQQGAAAVPAMRQFLARNVDLDFGLEGSQILGYSSVRTAMFDALQQIGGPEAMSLMLETLHTTSDPREIALLARNLEGQAPEQYRQEAINAAREALAMAAEGKLDDRDVGPLFEVLQKFGGATAVSDLEQAAGQWKYYASLSLAQLADGAGIPALIQMARDPAAAGKGTLGVALEMLARVASQYPEARSALIEQARQNKIPPNLWPYVASSLTGDQYQYLESVFGSTAATATAGDWKTIHIHFGNQNLSSAGGGSLSTDQINQQLSLIDELLLANNDSTAADPLRQSRDLLLKRLSRAPAGAAPGR